MTHTGGNTQRVGIKQGECYRVAQALVLTAKDPNVVYAEGVWGRGGSPHAWAMVDGYRVDPINELFVWRDGEREQWYEPFQEFTHEELRVALVEEGGYDDRTIARYEKDSDGPASYSIVHQRWLDDGNEIAEHSCHDLVDSCTCKDRSVMCRLWEDCDCEITQATMEPAYKRLIERIEAEKTQAVAA